MSTASWLGSGLKDLDALLRGQRTSPRTLREGIIDVPLRIFVPLAILLGGIYGFFMGWFALSTHRPEATMQVVAATLKLPMLFLLTLLVTFPSLYVFNALVGCRLSFPSAMRLLVAAIVVNLAVAASLGPILAFFTLSTSSYPFMVLLNVLLLGVAGIVGLGFLLRTLRRLEDAAALPHLATPAAYSAAATPVALRPDAPEVSSGAAGGIFKIWVIIYALVGAQMGWLLRPFIGKPDMAFEWFRPRDGNFFASVFDHLRHLFGS